jgi:hypothetical protein
MKFGIGEFYGKLSSHINLHLNLICLTMTLHEDLRAFVCVSKDCHYILYSRILRKIVEPYKFTFKSDWCNYDFT